MNLSKLEIKNALENVFSGMEVYQRLGMTRGQLAQEIWDQLDIPNVERPISEMTREEANELCRLLGMPCISLCPIRLDDDNEMVSIGMDDNISRVYQLLLCSDGSVLFQQTETEISPAEFKASIVVDYLRSRSFKNF